MGSSWGALSDIISSSGARLDVKKIDSVLMPTVRAGRRMKVKVG